MLRLTKIAPDAESHEEVFLGRYARLRSWATQLTDQGREQAEDLLHDAFIQFTLSRPDLNTISNLDGYLYRLLRNLHLSQVRRSVRVQHKTLSIVDYDSAEIGLRSGDPRQQIRLQDELRQVCQYACDRKETSSAGSVLILRFMHGYYPREIAQVMRSTRKAVEERLRIARLEARQYLLNPSQLHFMHGTAAGRTQVPTGFARSADQLLDELRRAVFDSRQGACLRRADLTSLYSESDRAGIDQPTLAHLASCPDCLDEVNGLLALPLLIERFPTDTIGTDKGSKGKGGGGGGDTGSTSGGGAAGIELRKSRRRARDVFEHRPAELCISVNGYLMAAQNVGAEISEQTLSINVAEKIDFIEVLGEQDVRLLFLSVEELPPDGAYQRSVRVELSDDRSLEATLSFSNPWPTLQVLYRDPLMSAGLAVPADAVPETHVKAAAILPDSAKAFRENLIFRAWRAFINSGFLLRPATVTAVLSLVLIAALLVVRLHVPTVSAAELLLRSTVAEETIASNPEVAIHRTINLEERAGNSTNVISRR
ncbi:MAG TPA: RNA polymerase sigma factor, partial [Pyrinomonadaceae bacterium]|nr:RNA polymerase sigma factor [Pyrinomonadaceae bacterium]